MNHHFHPLWGMALNAESGQVRYLTPGDPGNTHATLFMFRLKLAARCPETVTVRVFGSPVYSLYCNGTRLGRGSELHDARQTFCEKYHLALHSGDNWLHIQLWNPGVAARPWYRMDHVSLLAVWPEKISDRSRIATGCAPWEVRELPGFTQIADHPGRLAGPRVCRDGRLMAWDCMAPDAANYRPAELYFDSAIGELAHYDRVLPMMAETLLETPATVRLADHPRPDREAATALGAAFPDRALEFRAARFMADGEPLTFTPHSFSRIVFDLNDYFCLYFRLMLSGGRNAIVTVSFAEAFFREPVSDPYSGCKDDRSRVDGLFHYGSGDRFIADGGEREFEPLDWNAGRYLILLVQTGDEALTMTRLELFQTGYPLAITGDFQLTGGDGDKLAELSRRCRRTLRCCMHELYLDCPYYERLMYAGDTRLEMLQTYVTSHDRRLPRKAVIYFGSSLTASGSIQARYPSWDCQIIPSFSLWWIGMLHDYARWNDDPVTVGNLLPAARTVLDHFAGFAESDGAIRTPRGWNFYDWRWTCYGVPPGHQPGPGSLLNLHYLWSLKLLAELEDYAGTPDCAARFRSRAQSLTPALRERFYQPAQELFADDADHRHYSWHAQILALLSGAAANPPALYRRLLNLRPDEAAPCTLAFRHYLLEVMSNFGDGPALLNQFSDWFALTCNGFKTTPESPEPSRSDCHAWSSHPLYHLFCSVAGIRPEGFGLRRIRIAPPDCRWQNWSVRMPLTDGILTVERHPDRLTVSATGKVELDVHFAGRIEYLAPVPLGTVADSSENFNKKR